MARSRSPRRSASSTTGSARPEYSRPTLAWLQITINAGASDAIYLRGLNIDGLGTGGYGVLFNSGGSLAVTNCVVRHFSSTGIGIAPSSGTTLFSITNTIVSDNGTTGIYLGPVGTGSAKGTVTSVEASRNYIGIVVEGGGSTGTATFVLVSDASANNNSYAGISAEGAVKPAITRSTASGNNGYGVYVNSGTVYTYGDNRILGNSSKDIFVNGSLTLVSGS